MSVSVTNPGNGGAVVSPGTSTQVSVPPADGSSKPGTNGVSIATGQPGPPGPPGPAGPVGTEPDLPDLTLLFENGLI